MLTAEELDRVCVVLVRARNPNNIGAAARAMHDFGLRHLRVVNDFPVPFESARSAVDASSVLANAAACATLAEAVADCTLVVGTTAVGERDLQHELLPLPAAAPRLRAELRRSADSGSAAGRIALLFGSEKTGLSNDELSHCNWLLTVPMQQYEALRHPSMNLGQAVAVCLYELLRNESVQNESERKSAPPCSDSTAFAESQALAAKPSTAAEMERLTALFQAVLEETGYTRRHPANSDPAQLRRLLRRMAVDASDAPIWMGVLRQILWKIGGSPAK
jgi:tRNA/rRNA methyltransferase